MSTVAKYPFQHAAGAEAANREHQLDRIAESVDQHGFVGVALETVHGLILIRARRRMKADRRAQFLGFAPNRIVAAVVNVAAIGRLRDET